LIIAACRGVTRIEALPATLTHLHLGDLPALVSAAGIGRPTNLLTVKGAGVPIDAPATKAQLTWTRERRAHLV